MRKQGEAEEATEEYKRSLSNRDNCDFLIEVEAAIRAEYQSAKNEDISEILNSEELQEDFKTNENFDQKAVRRMMFQRTQSNVLQADEMIWPLDSDNGLLSYTKMRYVKD